MLDTTIAVQTGSLAFELNDQPYGPGEYIITAHNVELGEETVELGVYFEPGERMWLNDTDGRCMDANEMRQIADAFEFFEGVIADGRNGTDSEAGV